MFLLKKHDICRFFKKTIDFQVNIGDELEILTNGLFPATLHRVVVPQEEVGRGQCRQSIGFFANTDDAVLLEPVKGEKPKWAHL